MQYKLGQELYQVYVGDETDNYKCEMWTYIIRSKRGGFWYAINKTDYTWVKLSRKIGDFGWAKQIDALYREKTRVGVKFRYLHTTKLASWKEALTDRFTEEESKPAIRRQITKYKSAKSRK